MKRFWTILVLLALASVASGAMTYSASRFIDPRYTGYRNSGNQYLDPEYLFANEVEGYLEGTTAFPFVKMTSTDTEPGTTEGLLYYDTSEHMLKVRTNSAWTALGAGTFTGGNITSDVTLAADGVDILTSTTTAHNFAWKGYDVDNTTYRALFDVTNGNTLALVIGDGLASFQLDSTGLNVSSAGAVTGVTDLTYSGTVYGPALKAAAAGNAALTVDAAGSGAITVGGVSTGDTNFNGNVNIGNAATDTLTITSIIDASVTLDDGVTDSPSLILKDATDETATIAKVDAGFTTLTTQADDGLNILTGNLKVGNGSPGVAQNGEDAYVEGTLEVDGATTLDGALTVAGVLTASDAMTLSDGLTLDQPANNYFEITENGDTFQIIFGSNVWELGAGGTGVTTIDFNDVDALNDIESITGDNGQIILFSKNNYLEFTENGDTLGIIFGSNKLELAASGDGVTEIDCNDIDQITDVEYITGDLGVKIDLSINERVEFKDGAETFGFELDAANTVELCTDTGVTTIDCNDVDNFTDVESITGEGTGVLTGFLDTVVNDADAHSVLVTESGAVLTNASAVGAAAHTLPAAAAGLKFTFVVMAAQELRVTPAGGDAINIAGVQGDAAEYWTANAVGEVLTLTAVDGTNWIATFYSGTWTQQTP